MATQAENRRQIHPSQAHPRTSRRNNPKPYPLTFTAGLISLLPLLYSLTTVFLKLGHILPLLIYTILSIVSFTTYGYDKYRATNSGWRIRENLLHLLDILGGWPGGLFAQYLFRHKTRKHTQFEIDVDGFMAH
ncbi:DUF1294-domain-containing protein [Venturia nashicola]|nr:DUF1294-domain-containing protein [Venturia nashicola]